MSTTDNDGPLSDLEITAMLVLIRRATGVEITRPTANNAVHWEGAIGGAFREKCAREMEEYRNRLLYRESRS
jgi:hypothetical protein